MGLVNKKVNECILGISAFYHDSAACIVRDGVIVAAAQEERFTRIKHDHNFPINAVEFCMKQCEITSDDLISVVFYDKPWIKFERLLSTYLAFSPRGFKSFLMAMPLWLKQRLWIGEIVKKEIGYQSDILFPTHHQSHAASAFFPSPFESAAVITVDGVGEWATATWGVGKGNTIDIKYEMKFPHSLGLLYSAFTYYTGFKVNSGEYKVMGLAPYGEPKYVDILLKEVVDLKEDGSMRLNMNFFNYCQGLTMTSKAFDRLFGGPSRKPESKLSQREMDLARSVQVVAEMAMLKMASHVKKVTGEKNLCLAGGVALNCVANGKILKEKIFDHMWIQPASGDAGGALGAALFAWHQVMGKPRYADGVRDSQRGCYLGPVYKTEEIETWLKSKGYPYRKYGREELSKIVAQYINEQKIIGWFAGPMEFGPRALGGRSIIADARNPKMQEILSLKIKFRESFRPFGPSCLLEDVSEYFELAVASPYMLLAADVRPERRLQMTEDQNNRFGMEKLTFPRSDIPAITHVDYSARIQTVDRWDNPHYYDIINEFKKLTGYGVIINTSFNIRGEPIVCKPEDAYRCFMKTELDVLVLENCILLKGEQKR